MVCQKNLSYQCVLGFAFFVEFLTFSLAAPSLRAQSLKVSITFPPVENRGTLSRTAGGGTRGGDCLTGKTPLTALTPTNNIGTTVSGNPTFFWYIPQSEAKSAEFVVTDNQYQEIYATTLALNGTPGVVSLSLPATVSLETGKDYYWYVLLICDPKNREQDMFVEGVVKRTELSLEQKTKLAAATEPLKQAEMYAQAKIWQETLAILAQLRHDRPNDSKVIDAWKELLNSVELEAIATEPLVKCCKADK